MITEIVVAILVLFSIGAVAAAVLIGTFTFSPLRPRATRVAEAVTATEPPSVPILLDPVVAAPVRRFGTVNRIRLDRHDSYVWIAIGINAFSWSTLAAPSPNSNISALDSDTQYALALCLMVGSSFMLLGSALGLRIFRRWTIAPRVRDNPVSGILGDDIRMPYLLSWFGLLSISVSMIFYAGTIITHASSIVIGTLGGGLSLALIAMSATLGIRLLHRIYLYTHAREALITRALAQEASNESG